MTHNRGITQEHLVETMIQCSVRIERIKVVNTWRAVQGYPPASNDTFHLWWPL